MIGAKAKMTDSDFFRFAWRPSDFFRGHSLRRAHLHGPFELRECSLPTSCTAAGYKGEDRALKSAREGGREGATEFSIKTLLICESKRRTLSFYLSLPSLSVRRQRLGEGHRVQHVLSVLELLPGGLGRSNGKGAFEFVISLRRPFFLREGAKVREEGENEPQQTVGRDCRSQVGLRPSRRCRLLRRR